MPDRAAQLQKTFGETIRRERLARHLTQEALAEKAELSLNFIGNLERGEKLPSLDTMVKLADALGLKGTELMAKAKL